MAKPGAPQRYQDIPLEIVGSTKFGRYPKMSSEQTYNMLVSDGWLVPFAGYKKVVTINPTGQGRGIYSSAKLNKMFAVIDDVLWIFEPNLTHVSASAHLTTSIGDVFISENNNGQVAISDEVHIYIYDNAAGTLTQATIDFTPGYLTFQDGRFISPDRASNQWRLSDLNQGLTWPADSQHIGSIQTKPDRAVACIRFPGRGNLILVFGKTVAEQWYDVGAQLFPYQRSQSTNIDYGCINPATIAESENVVCWIAANEKSGPVIMYTNGGEIKHISNDGIDFKLAQLKFPANCYGFMFKQDGHLFYVVSWPQDNLSYAFDFNAQAFYTLCDENMDVFTAKKVAFFNDQYYFVSLDDGNIYQLSSKLVDYDYGEGRVFEIPRIRIPKSIQMPDQSRFVAGYCGFTVEQGQFDYPDVNTLFDLTTQDGASLTTQNGTIIGGGEDFTNNVARIDMSVSKDGGVNWGSNVQINMRPLGVRQNKVIWWRLGAANDLVPQFRFWGFGRFVATNGIIGVYQ